MEYPNARWVIAGDSGGVDQGVARRSSTINTFSFRTDRWSPPRLGSSVAGRSVAGRERRRSHRAVPVMAIATADAIVAMSQAGVVLLSGFGAAARTRAGGTEAAELRADGSEAPAGMPSRARVAVRRGVPRNHPVACSGWPKPC